MDKIVILLVLPSLINMAAVKVNHHKNQTDMLPGEDDWKTWTKEELEKQMNPSQWNPNMTSDEAMNQYVDLGERGTEKSRQNLHHTLDVPYGPLPLEKFDIYGTDLPDTAPILFWVHGGYWQFRGKELAGHFTLNAYHWGFKTIVLGYTLAPQATIKEIQVEIEEALKLALKMFPKADFIVGGHSAGAPHLLFNDVDSRIPQLLKQLKGLLFVSGVYDLRPLVNTTINDNLHLTLETATELSPLFNKINPVWTSIGLKNCILVGNYDSPEFKRQTQGFVEQLKGDLKVKYWISLDDDHFTIVENFAVETTEAGQTLKDYLQQFTRVKDDHSHLLHFVK